jgi:ketosteroid isomerase-like protein
MSENKHLVERIFSELAKGNGRPFVDSMADDFTWIVKGTTAWSGTYRGKEAVRTELLDPLLAQFASPYTNTARRIIAEGDHVVVECQGNVTTSAGKRYDNTYCYVLRLAGGRLKELTEYLDTELVTAALEPPPR